MWSVLTDPTQLVNADTGVLALNGEIREGARITLRSCVAPKRDFRLHVAAYDAPGRMVWQDGMPLGLFKGIRSFELTPSPTGTRFYVKEVYVGPLAFLITRMIPDLQPSFEKFADGVARMAEG